MTPEKIIALVVVVLVGVALLAKLVPQRMPPKKLFKCGRCGTGTLHNDRTAEAWRNGKTKFFCQACHAKWLQDRPPVDREQYTSRSSGRTGSGCLGVVALSVLLPICGLLAWAYV